MQQPRWTSHVETGFKRVGGYLCPSCSTIGVANAQTIHDRKMTANKRPQACCIPTARMPTTIWVAFKMLKPNHTTVIQNHWENCRRWWLNPINQVSSVAGVA